MNYEQTTRGRKETREFPTREGALFIVERYLVPYQTTGEDGRRYDNERADRIVVTITDANGSKSVTIDGRYSWEVARGFERL